MKLWNHHSPLRLRYSDNWWWEAHLTCGFLHPLWIFPLYSSDSVSCSSNWLCGLKSVACYLFYSSLYANLYTVPELLLFRNVLLGITSEEVSIGFMWACSEGRLQVINCVNTKLLVEIDKIINKILSFILILAPWHYNHCHNFLLICLILISEIIKIILISSILSQS